MKKLLTPDKKEPLNDIERDIMDNLLERELNSSTAPMGAIRHSFGERNKHFIYLVPVSRPRKNVSDLTPRAVRTRTGNCEEFLRLISSPVTDDGELVDEDYRKQLSHLLSRDPVQGKDVIFASGIFSDKDSVKLSAEQTLELKSVLECSETQSTHISFCSF